MARSSTRRQKQLERKRAKRAQKRKAIAKHEPQGRAQQIARASSAPILDCIVYGDSEGVVQVLFSRQVERGLVAFAIFLVDAWCLGVKDAFTHFARRQDYEDMAVTPLRERFPARHVSPAWARKFVEGAVEYARSLGLEPHPGYRKAAPIFGDIDPEECHETFEFGHDGRPHFVSGPNDTPERCRRVVQTLRDRLGEDGFKLSAYSPVAELFGALGIDFDDDSFDDDDEWDDDEAV
jgi:hypothetical protein